MSGNRHSSSKPRRPKKKAPKKKPTPFKIVKEGPEYNPEKQLRIQEMGYIPDPRLYSFAEFLPKDKDTGKNMLATAGITASIGNCAMKFSIPSHAALCMNISRKAFLQASGHGFKDLARKRVTCEATSEGLKTIYDFFEEMIKNTVFAYTALEAFVNENIPDNFIYQRDQQGKCIEAHDKTAIERNIQLDEKLAVVMPQITGIEFDKGDKLWNDFKEMKDIRDRLIHGKTADLGIHDTEIKSLWDILLERHDIDASLIAHKLMLLYPIKYDHSLSPLASGRNRWLDYYPFEIRFRPEYHEIIQSDRKKREARGGE